MTDVYETSIAALRIHLQTRKDLLQRSLSALKTDSECAEDHRRLIRVYNALIRKFETEVSFERELRGHDVRRSVGR